jgi:hypothetical protein
LLSFFTLFSFASFYQKYKKIVPFSLVRMSILEVEVRSFKQQGGESLKDAWYRISNVHHRCTKKYSTMILLRNFYVGISSWNSYVLDTLTGGNFLGPPALEASNLIESLVGVPHISVVKTEITLEEVIRKLSSLEKSLPNLLDNASHVNESIESIGKRITVLEASTIHDSQNLRIGKLEESIETLSSIFSSLKFKKEKAFVGKEQKFMYVPNVSIPRPQNVFKSDKTFSATKSGLHVESSSEVSKVPIVTSCVFEKTIDLDASSFENT